jgi:hypothetical protein
LQQDRTDFALQPDDALQQPEGTTRLVLITRGLSAPGLRASFAAALAGSVTD